MKIPFKRLLIILVLCLTVALSACFFAACAANGGDNGKTDDDNGNSSEEPAETFVLSYTANGGTGTAPLAVEAKDGDYVTVAKNTFTKGSYAFLGWSDGSAVYQPDDIFVIRGASVSLSALWETESDGEMTFTLLDDNTYAVTTCTYAYNAISVPTTYNARYVTVISANAFAGATSATSITVPQSVSTIECGAFAGCTKLTSIVLPFIGGGTEVKEYNSQYVFGYAFGTESYANAYQAGDYYLPKSLSKVTISGGDIPAEAFRNCINVKIAELPYTLTKIRANVFTDSGVTSVYVPSSVTDIDISAFGAATSSIEVDGGNEKYSSSAGVLYNKNGSEIIKYPTAKTGNTFVLPSTVKYIGTDAFDGCTAALDLSESAITNLSANLKGYLGTLITLGGTVKTISGGTFAACANLIEIRIGESGSDYFSIQYGVLFDSEKNIVACLSTAALEENYYIYATEIYPYAFYNVKGLKNVKFGGDVVKIGEKAFWSSGVSEVVIPYGVHEMADDAFGAGVKISFESSVAPSGFNSTYAEDEVYGYLSIKYLEDWDFSVVNEVAVLKAYKGEHTANLVIPSTIAAYNVGSVGTTLRGASWLESVTLPNTITTISPYAFYGTSITSLTVPASVVELKPYAFADSQFDIIFASGANGKSSSLTTIGSYAFLNARLTDNYSLTLSENVRDIGTGAFMSSRISEISFAGTRVYELPDKAFCFCSSLKKVVFGNALQSVGKGVFEYCVSLNDVDFSAVNNLSNIGENMFSDCISLTSVEIPEAVDTIGAYAFYGCFTLEEVLFADDSELLDLGAGVFENCYSLATAEIPLGVNTTGEDCFRNCFALVIKCRSLSAPENGVWADGWNGERPIIWNCRENYVGADNTIYFTVGDNLYLLKRSAVSLVRYGGTPLTEKVTYGTSQYDLVAVLENAFTLTGFTDIVIPKSVTSIAANVFDNVYITSLTLPFAGTGATGSSLGELFLAEEKIKEEYGSYPESLFDTYFNKATQSVRKNGITVSQTYLIPKTLASLTILGGTLESGDLEGFTSLKEIIIGEDVTVSYGAFGALNQVLLKCQSASKPSAWSALWNANNNPVVWDCNNNNVASDGYEYSLIDGTLYRLDGSVAAIYSAFINEDFTPSTVITVDGTDYDVTTVIDGAFNYTDVENFNFLNGDYFTAENGALFNKNKTVLIAVANNNLNDNVASEMINYIVADTVTEIRAFAFYNNKNLKTVTIPSELTAVGAYAFYGAANLTSVTFESGALLTTLGDGAFENCVSLTYVSEFGDNLTSIGSRAFAGCKLLSGIVIPETVTTIGDYAFYGCDALTIQCKIAALGEGFSWSNTWNYDGRTVIWGE